MNLSASFIPMAVTMLSNASLFRNGCTSFGGYICCRNRKYSAIMYLFLKIWNA